MPATGTAIVIALVALVILLLSGLYIHSVLLSVGIIGIIALHKTAVSPSV